MSLTRRWSSPPRSYARRVARGMFGREAGEGREMKAWELRELGELIASEEAETREEAEAKLIRHGDLRPEELDNCPELTLVDAAADWAMRHA